MKALYKDSEKVYNCVGHILLVLFAIFLFTRAYFGPICYDEIDTNALPVISIQYRGSFLSNESDLVFAQKDFPNLYKGINKFGDLRNSKMRMISENQWLPYYFPIYPALCVPVKLLLTLFRMDQERCFFITNATLIVFSLWFVQQKLNVAAKQRLIALILLMLSPIFLYNNYINYEAFMCSFLTLSLVQYYNGRHRSSAVLLSLAGMSNAAVMAVGIVMVFEYLYRMGKTCLNNPITFKNFRKYTVDTVLYGVWYIPCLIPFIINASLTKTDFVEATTRYVKATTSYAGSVSALDIPARILTYLFDPTLGLFSFAPFELLAFLVLAIIAMSQKDFQALIWTAFLLGTISAFSFMSHINCGMIYCARYLVWSYPIIPLFLATIGYETVKSHLGKCILYPVLIVTTGLLLCVNTKTALAGFVFNRSTEWILCNVPQVYNPYKTVFYSRTLHVDGIYLDYNITIPAYYKDPMSDEIRKLIFKADPESAEQVISDLTGDEASMDYLKAQLDRYGMDGKYHYINFPYSGRYQVLEKSLEEKYGMKNISTLVEESDFFLNDVGDHQIANFPIIIHENTRYKVVLTLADDVDFSTAEELVIDFCGPAYDRAEQEANSFVRNGRYQYTFYFNSGEFESDSGILIGQARMFVWNLDTAIHVEKFSVTEMGVSSEETVKIKRAATLAEESDFSLNDMGDHQLACFPITIQDNTVYKVELVLADNVDFSAAVDLVVDFCGPAYDRAEQEANHFVLGGKYQYTFYFDSGEFEDGGDILDCQARVFIWNLDTVIQVKSFTVEEMEILPVED